MRPCLEKNLHKKRAGGVAQGIGPEFKLQFQKKKTKTIKIKKSYDPTICRVWIH
jgi:hypothetical protein